MRTLASPPYTADQVETRLRGGAGADDAEFWILDQDMNVIGDLTQNVTAATVDIDIDRAVKGSLTLAVVPHDLPDIDGLRTAWFRYYIQPWWLLRMDDGGTARWPMGVYLWHPPDRAISGRTATADSDEEWALTLGDRTHDLDMTGPGAGPGFKTTPDELVTDVVARALVRAGITDTTGIAPSAETVGAYYTWSLVRDRVRIPHSLSPTGKRIVTDDTEPETWLSIVDQLLDSIGYSNLWFDATGRARAQPASTLDRVAPTIVYDTAADGVVLRPQNTKHDPSRLANRVWCRAQRRNGTLLAGKADANDVVPGHPISQGVIGRYIDIVEDIKIAPSKPALEARARKKLLKRLSTYETFTLDTLAWPAHEAFDTVAVRLDDDPEFGAEAVFHEQAWSMTLRGQGDEEGTMTHELSRLVQVADQ